MKWGATGPLGDGCRAYHPSEGGTSADIMELGAIGELVGGVAVMGSLIYVGLQVRQSNRQAREDAAREIQNGFDRFFETIMTDPKVREMWVLASGGVDRWPVRNPANLSPDDLALFTMLLARVWQMAETHYLAWRSGTLSDAQWARMLPFMRIHLSSDPALDLWHWQREGFAGGAFAEYIDNEVREIHERAEA